MPSEFVFVPTPYSAELQEELAKALRARTEIISRKMNPKLWRMTDGVNRFAEANRADDPVLKRRKTVQTVLSTRDGPDGAEEHDAACRRRDRAGHCGGAAPAKAGREHDAAVSEIRVAAAKEPRRDGSVVKAEDSIHGRGNADQDKPEIGRLPV